MCGCVNGCSYLCKYGVKMTKYELKARIKQYNNDIYNNFNLGN